MLEGNCPKEIPKKTFFYVKPPTFTNRFIYSLLHCTKTVSTNHSASFILIYAYLRPLLVRRTCSDAPNYPQNDGAYSKACSFTEPLYESWHPSSTPSPPNLNPALPQEKNLLVVAVVSSSLGLRQSFLKEGQRS